MGLVALCLIRWSGAKTTRGLRARGAVPTRPKYVSSLLSVVGLSVFNVGGIGTVH